ncbi:MAG: osmotically inducible protein OsmC [Bacteroidetes bacterium HGW-Bacteroidetes-12]|nr:MAG: osmotically inducible protein OsmC [Bacteroidetes bacterium HGW-Bacteroidetes-12]
MATSNVIYKGQLRTELTHLSSGNKVITDAPVDNHGKGEAFSPTDIVATALASCMFTIIGIKAADSNFNITNAFATVTKIMSASPRKISEIVIEFDFRGGFYSDKEKKLIENSAKTCPVALSLSSDIKQTLIFLF